MPNASDTKSLGPVRDNIAQGRYEMQLADAVAFITYRRSPGTVSLDHTEVPEAYAGKGVGSALIQGTLDMLRAEGSKVVPRCSFVKRFIEKHPAYADLVVER
jgi:predicted GNAT family acetyltransferase